MVPPVPLVSPVAVAAAAPVAPPDRSPIAPVAYAQELPHPVFHDLFRTDGRSGVSATVSELWGVRSTSAAPPAAAAPSGAAPGANGAERFRAARSPT
jgi:hypothetical protein